jgi:hypothetical protein
MKTTNKYGIEISVTCAWGDGPNVLLTIYRENECPVFVNLTKEEAKSIGYNLLNSASQASNFENLCKEHDDWIENEKT